MRHEYEILFIFVRGGRRRDGLHAVSDEVSRERLEALRMVSNDGHAINRKFARFRQGVLL